MNEKLIGAEPIYCEKVNRDIILARFEDEFITGDHNNPVKMIRLVECLSRGEIAECSICKKIPNINERRQSEIFPEEFLLGTWSNYYRTEK